MKFTSHTARAGGGSGQLKGQRRPSLGPKTAKPYLFRLDPFEQSFPSFRLAVVAVLDLYPTGAPVTDADATKFWTFRWEYYCQRCSKYEWAGVKSDRCYLT